MRPASVAETRFNLRKIEGAGIFLEYETNIFPRNLNKLSPVIPEPPQTLEVCKNSPKKPWQREQHSGDVCKSQPPPDTDGSSNALSELASGSDKSDDELDTKCDGRPECGSDDSSSLSELTSGSDESDDELDAGLDCGSDDDWSPGNRNSQDVQEKQSVKSGKQYLYTIETVIGSDASPAVPCHTLNRLTWAQRSYLAISSLGPSKSSDIYQWILTNYPSSIPTSEGIETMRSILRRDKSRFISPKIRDGFWSINTQCINAMEHEISEWSQFSARERGKVRGKISLKQPIFFYVVLDEFDVGSSIFTQNNSIDIGAFYFSALISICNCRIVSR
jgi:hypothetical protein